MNKHSFEMNEKKFYFCRLNINLIFMKKIALILTLCLIVMMSFAQRQQRHNAASAPFQYGINEPHRSYEQRMVGYSTSDNYEMVNYTYNDQNQVIDMYHLWTGYEELHDSLHYNELGQLIRDDGYQFLDTQWKHVYYIEYTYNAQGRLDSRTNYNFFSNEWQLGGVYNYYYNTDGQLVQTDLTMGGSLVQTIEYEYENGNLVLELWSSGWGSLEPSEKLEYEYENGKVVRINDYYYEDGYWDYAGREEFEYDANGNCVLHQTLSATDDVTSKSIYEFNNTLLANTVIPYTPDEPRPCVYTNTNNFVLEEWYGMDDNNVLQYICDYIYDYDNDVTVTDFSKSEVAVSPNPVSNMLKISGVAGVQVEIFDMQGRLMKSFTAENDVVSVNVSAFPAGLYILKASGTTQKFCVTR